MNIQLLQNLANSLQGEFYYDQTMRTLWATEEF
jgi:hypothetical protein